MAKHAQGILFVIAVITLFSQAVKSAQVKQDIADNNSPMVIQSQVKGSQEQPNVIYIMPWQGVDQVIEVKGKKRTIKLPQFKPINPKIFKEQVRLFANKQLALKAGAEK